MKATTRWVGYYALLFLLLFAAGAGYSWMRPRYGPVYRWPWSVIAEVHALEQAAPVLRAKVADLRKRSASELDNRQLQSLAAIDGRLNAIGRELADRRFRDKQAGSIARQAMGGADRIVEVYSNRLELHRLEIEDDFLRRLRAPAKQIAAITDRRANALERHRIFHLQCASLQRQVEQLKGRWIWQRYDLPRWRNLVADKTAERDQTCRAHETLLQTARKISLDELAARAALHNAPIAATEYSQEIADVSDALGRKWLFVAKTWTLAHRALAVGAAIGVALAILMPFAIRVLFYYGLAPRASRRRLIRLLPESAPMRPDGAHSAVGQDIAIPLGWELLAKPRYLHRIPIGGRQRSKLLMTNRAPLASILRGLWLMTRIRHGADGASATLSAGGDAFAELLTLRLEQGQACMLLPRLIVGVLQPIDRPLRVTRHWRINSLQAWLTSQLRYLVFHGPAVVVLKGYRGLHVLAAETDIELPQDHVVGFSANLSYGVVRTGTFQPYFLGQSALLRDVVLQGPGIVVMEEAPGLGTGKAGHSSRHRLEGALDVILKFFGL